LNINTHYGQKYDKFEKPADPAPDFSRGHRIDSDHAAAPSWIQSILFHHGLSRHIAAFRIRFDRQRRPDINFLFRSTSLSLKLRTFSARFAVQLKLEE
jgi:hypothetical protein